MKKIKAELLAFYDRRNKKIAHLQKRAATSKKHRAHNKSLSTRKREHIYNLKYRVRYKRFLLLKSIHKGFKYSDGKKEVKVHVELGLEEKDQIDQFLDFASSVIDFDASELVIELKDCGRVWPSGVTLLCSLKEWVEFAANYNKLPHPKISSTDSSDAAVNSYLSHCGFYDYVGRLGQSNEVSYSDKHVVKICREDKQVNIEKREDDICELLRNVTSYSEEDIEWFYVILIEVFLNVQEHGISCHDLGWWTLAQYHEKHKIISLNVADNGVGFRNTLATGPQKDQLLEKLENSKVNDGEFIRMAMEENVSGAFNASVKHRDWILKKYDRGSRRGNGLERIREVCVKLGIEFSILSHYGYVFCDRKGNIRKAGYKENRVFAGTLYHFNIPTEFNL